MDESTSWYQLKEAIRKEASGRGFAVHLVRIENLMSKGIFDCNMCYKGVECWLEGKFIRQFPLRKSTLVKIGFSGDQELFAIRRLMVGGKLFVWVNVSEGVMAEPGDDGSCKKLVGRGWYLFELASIAGIQALRQGLSQDVMLSRRFVSVGALVVALLDRLDGLELSAVRRSQKV